VLPLTTGAFIRFQISEMGALSAQMLQTIRDSGKPVQIELMGADGGTRMIFQLSDISSFAEDIDLTVLQSFANDAIAAFFGGHAYTSLFFGAAKTIPARMRVFIPNDGQFSKSEKMYLYLYENGEFKRTEIPVAFSADETMISFEVGYTGSFIVSPYRVSGAEESEEVPAPPVKAANHTLLIVLISVGGVLVLGGVCVAIFLLRRKRKTAVNA
jgi:hypothetical protein